MKCRECPRCHTELGGRGVMDLTNIKPCVECAKWKICFTLSSVDRLASFRIGKILVKGEDCFVEEVADGWSAENFR